MGSALAYFCHKVMILSGQRILCNDNCDPWIARHLTLSEVILAFVYLLFALYPGGKKVVPA
ncbi:MAG: hypothetical protein R3A12_10775 [Ignavibacteria bacterium]